MREVKEETGLVCRVLGRLSPVAYVTPLWHGVELTRGAALSQATEFNPAVHVAYLLAWFVAGAWLALRLLRQRLEK